MTPGLTIAVLALALAVSTGLLIFMAAKQHFAKLAADTQARPPETSETDASRAGAKLARQVAHDIRSPLTALTVVAQDLSPLPEAKRRLVLGAITRLQEIASHLSGQAETAAPATIAAEKIEPAPIPVTPRPGDPTDARRALSVSEIRVAPQATIVVVDDDPAIHDVWRRRFDSLSGPTLVHFPSPGALAGWRSPRGPVVYLIDYDFQGCSENGLDLIGRLRIAPQSILVTGHCTDENVVRGCETLGVRLLPKHMAGHVPIRKDESGKVWDAVLIDDDPLVHATWKIQAAKTGKALQAFLTSRDFFSAAESLDRHIPIYIDYHLGDGANGESLAREIHARGFRNLYLATGAPEAVTSTEHVRGIIGKEPPWAS